MKGLTAEGCLPTALPAAEATNPSLKGDQDSTSVSTTDSSDFKVPRAPKSDK